MSICDKYPMCTFDAQWPIYMFGRSLKKSQNRKSHDITQKEFKRIRCKLVILSTRCRFQTRLWRALAVTLLSSVIISQLTLLHRFLLIRFLLCIKAWICYSELQVTKQVHAFCQDANQLIVTQNLARSFTNANIASFEIFVVEGVM